MKMWQRSLVVGLFVGLGFVVNGALASPDINGAVINLRVFNDDPASTVTFGNLWPNSLWIMDEHLNQGNYANRHNFRLSDNGGISEAVFMNHDAFTFAADVTLTGTAREEGGLNLSPWWSKEVDGVFMLNGATGEIAVFGGRLPFYSFTGNYGLQYTMGTTVRQKMIYDPHGLTQADPATIVYQYTVGGTTYSSGPLAFDQGNPNEDPPYGLWGMLNDARVGGYFQPQINTQDPNNWGRIDFGNMEYTPEPASLALVALLSLVGLRRR